jgi:hypothetical protein
MSAANPLLLRTALRNCAQVDGEAVYNCLKSHLGEDGGASRSPREVIIRSLGIHIVCLASYGHLMSVQGAASKRLGQAFAMLSMFFFFPELPLAQLLDHVATTLVRRLRKRHVSLRYSIAVCLGSHVLVDDDMIPLSNLDSTHVQYERMSYNLIWVGRLILLLLILVQQSGILGIRYRSLFILNHYGNIYCGIDTRNSQIVFGGMTAVIQSVLLALFNLKWHSVPQYSESIPLGNTEPVGVIQETPGLQERFPNPSVESSSEQIQRSTTNFPSYYHICSNWCEYLLSNFFRRSLEGAIVVGAIRRTVELLSIHRSGKNWEIVAFMLEKDKNAIGLHPYYLLTVTKLVWSIEGPILICRRGWVSLEDYTALVIVLISGIIRLLSRNDISIHFWARIWKAPESPYTSFNNKGTLLSFLTLIVIIVLRSLRVLIT